MSRKRTSANRQQRDPDGNALLARVNRRSCTDAAANLTALDPSTVTNVGGSQAHLNMQPFLTLNFCIALQGIFPSPN